MTSSAPTSEVSPTRDRIMDAVLRILRGQALGETAVEQVADVSGVSRQTIYRHFGSRDGLIRAVVIREEERLAEHARKATAGATSLDEAIVAAVSSLLQGVREHPLIDRMLADDPGSILPYLTLSQGPVLGTAESIVGDLLARFLAGARDDAVETVADVVSRLVISYTIAPGHHTPREVGELTARIVHGILAD